MCKYSMTEMWRGEGGGREGGGREGGGEGKKEREGGEVFRRYTYMHTCIYMYNVHIHVHVYSVSTRQ